RVKRHVDAVGNDDNLPSQTRFFGHAFKSTPNRLLNRKIERSATSALFDGDIVKLAGRFGGGPTGDRHNLVIHIAVGMRIALLELRAKPGLFLLPKFRQIVWIIWHSIEAIEEFSGLIGGSAATIGCQANTHAVANLEVQFVQNPAQRILS